MELTKMHNKLFAITGIAFAISGGSQAEYTVAIPLDHKTFNFQDKDINGTIKLDPTIINRGQSSNIIWDYEYANKINIDGLGSYTQKNGSHTVSPLRSTTYNITIENGSKSLDEQVYLKVIQPDPEIVFTANKYKIGTGESVNLSWDLKHIDSATLDNGIGAIVPNSTLTVYPVGNTTYNLIAQGYFNEKTANKLLDIIVVENSIINLFNVNKNKFTIGETALFSWNVNNSEKLELLPYGVVDKSKTSQAVLLNTIGNFDYSLKTMSYNNTTVSSNPLTISVYGEPIINTFTVNNSKTATVEKGENIKFDWATTHDETTTLDGLTVSSKTLTQKAPDTNKTYTLSIINGAGKSVEDNVIVNVVEPVSILSMIAPVNVFANAPFTMNWTGTGVSKYELSSGIGSGIDSNDDLGITTTKVITPTTSGSYTYTLTAKNLAEKSTTKTSNVTVENDPTLTGLTVNGQTAITVSPSTNLSFAISGQSSGAVIQGRNSAGTDNITLPTTASTTAGSTTYYASATKTLNNISRYSPVKSVSVNVVNNPTLVAITAPSIVYPNIGFTLSWTGTDAIKYKIKSNNAASGISISDIDLGTALSTTVIPTTPGSYIYTLTATNAAGVSASKSVTVVVENLPTFSDFTVNGTSTITVAPSTALTFAGAGFSTGSFLQGRNSSGTTDMTLPTTANATAGSTTYYAAAMKTINGVTNYSAVRSVSVIVVNAPSITSMTAPTTVFVGSSFTMSWAGTNAINYKIKSNNAISGIATTDIDVGTGLTRSITPTAAGTYTYTITATNAAGVKATSTKQVVVEALPTFTGFTVNGAASITVAPSTSLTFVGAGFSTGSILQGRNSSGTVNAALPSTASATAGTTTYYASATKTVNGVVENSPVRSVSVTVVSAPTITTITAPTPVFVGSAFTMSWTGTNATNYKIKSNNATSGIATTDIDVGTGVSRSITPTAVGTYTYTITATNAAGVSVTSTKQVIVETLPTFTGFTVNGAASITVAPSTALTFAGTGFSTGATLQGRNSSGTVNAALPSTASATAGTTTYYASATKTVNGVIENSVVRSVVVSVVSAPTITSITSPTPVFEDSAFTMSWAGTNATNYKIKSNNATSGIAITDVDLGTATSRSITPTAAGTYTYTITATNAAGVVVTSTKQVVVESLPIFTGFNVNGAASITVAPSTALTFVGTGFSTGATLQARNSAGSANATFPTTASATAGTTIYYASATKTLNGVTNYSVLDSVSVTVVSAPTITSITAPTPVFKGAAFTMSWVGANSTNYKIKSNNATSGITVADIDLGTATSRSVTPTAAGTYTYTITATNAAGVSVTSTKQVIVEDLPTFTRFTVNGSSTINVAPSAALTFSGSGFSSGSVLQSRNSAGTANATFPTTASPTAGTTIYYASATKSLNGITNYSAIRSVSVVVVASPTITSITAPTNVFNAAAFTMSWAGTNATNYKIKSNNASSGITVSDIDLGTATSSSITPTAAGTYTYTITATNAAGVAVTSTKQVIVEADPTVTSFTVNGVSTQNVTPSAALTFAISGQSAGSVLVGRNSANTANATLPTTASGSAGATTYYGAVSKTLNGVIRFSSIKSVVVNVIANPVISSFTAPASGTSKVAFSTSWVATGATNYKIKSNNAASGIATTDLDLGVSTSRSITPTSAGTFIYTLTATNSLGVKTESTKQVVVSGQECRAATASNQWSYYENNDDYGISYTLYVVWDGIAVWQADTPIPEGSFTRNGYKYSPWKSSTLNQFGVTYGVCRE